MKEEAEAIMYKSMAPQDTEKDWQYQKRFPGFRQCLECSGGCKGISTLKDKHKYILEKSEVFLETITNPENPKTEYDIFRNLYRIHAECFNMQESLDLISECLVIAHKLKDKMMVQDTMAQKGLLYLLLGKYQESYQILLEVHSADINDDILKTVLLCNLSVVTLLLGKIEKSRKFAWHSFDVAKKTGNVKNIALAHGNIGLAEESMKNYATAIEHYQECLQLGKSIRDNRIINNSYCNLGRAYEGLHKRSTAREYYKKAIETPQPPKAHWCDTEDMRFRGDFLLAKMAIEDEEWSQARKYLEQVLKRCESFRKSVQDSTLKIIFNDTQRKPYQYLQHVLLKQGAIGDALLVGEKGRARDFYDKVLKEEDDKKDRLNTPKALLNFVKRQKVAVLCLSTLDVVNQLCGWFISASGVVEKFSVPENEWAAMLTKLCVAMHRLQDRYKTEIRGVPNKDNTEDHGIHKDRLEMFPNNDEWITKESSPDEHLCSSQLCSSESGDFLGQETSAKPRGPLAEHGTKSTTKTPNPDGQTSTGLNADMQSGLLSQETLKINAEQLSTIIERLSKLFVKPIENHLDKLINSEQRSTENPKLLIIPQGKTFNIPFAALHLADGQPLCSKITLFEAFSFHSFSHAIRRVERTTKDEDILADSLIVGNPTRDLPCAEAEARIIAGRLGVEPVIRTAATRSEVIRRLPHGRIIHFACHGTCDGKRLKMAVTGQSCKDNFLTIEDISKMVIRADMIVLSACHTARGVINGEGVLGLARAFLVAGAKTVVTALWAIPDEPTKLFMGQFYQNLSEGQPVADALRTTMCQIKERKELKNVIHWGSFKVLGANHRIF